MTRRTSGLPPRVLAIAALLVGAIGLLAWLVRGLGSPAVAPPPEEPPVVAEEPLAASADADIPVEPLPEAPAEDTVPAPLGEVQTEQVTLQLFLVDPLARRLTTRIRRIEAPMTTPAQAQLALQALAAWRDAELLSPLLPGTVIREVWVSPAGIAYVDFPRNFPGTLGQGSQAELFAVYGVVGTLTSSFPNISAVQFLVDGQPVDTLVGHIDLSQPVKPLADWVY